MLKLELTPRTLTIDTVEISNLVDHKQAPPVVARILLIETQLLYSLEYEQVRTATAIKDSKVTEQMVRLKINMIKWIQAKDSRNQTHLELQIKSL